jgi:hypothetical protein
MEIGARQCLQFPAAKTAMDRTATGANRPAAPIQGALVKVAGAASVAVTSHTQVEPNFSLYKPLAQSMKTRTLGES